MADRFLVVIPAEHTSELPDTAEAIKDLLAQIAGSVEARVKDYGKLQFIDAGLNAQRIGCPNCGLELAQRQWLDWMDGDWHDDDGFHLHMHQMPCCGVPLRLDALAYDAPQGFARWLIAARTERESPLTSDELARLENAAGIPLKPIAQKY